MREISEKILSRKNIRDVFQKSERGDKKVVFTNGCFDLIHVGHTRYLREAAKLGDILVVAVNTDESVRKLKGASRPISPLEHRMEILASLECVDYVCDFYEETPEKIIQEISPDVLVKGADYNIRDIVGADFVFSNGGTVETISFVQGQSTSEIIRKVKEA